MTLLMFSQIFKETLLYRRRRWSRFRSLISANAKGSFTYLLSGRNFRGRIITDHVNKLLDLQVSAVHCMHRRILQALTQFLG